MRLIDWDNCATVPLIGYDPVSFFREDDEEICLALFSEVEREGGESWDTQGSDDIKRECMRKAMELWHSFKLI